MSRILGLDIGAHSVKALLLESGFRGFQVRSFTEARITEGGLAGALAALAEDKRLTADQVIVAVPGTAVATHVLTLPFSDPRRIEATLGFEVEGQLPYDLADVVYDHQLLSTRPDGKSEILVGVVKRDELSGLVSRLAEAGVDPRVITTSALAYQNLLTEAFSPKSGPVPVDGAEAILDIGHERSSVNIGRRDTGTEYARTFGGGGRDLTRAVAAEFKVSLEDAQAWKENEGDVTLDGATPEQERAAAALLRALSPILREVRSTLRAHNARFHRNVERIHLCGGTAKLRGLPELLSRELSVPVQLLDTLPPEAVSALPSGTSPVTCQAFALAMRGHGSSRAARFNLRKGEFAFKGDLDYLKGKVSRLVAFAAVLTLLSGTLVWAQLKNLETREKSLDRMLCDTTQRVVGQCQKDYLVALSLLKGKGSPVSLIPAYSALDLFAELTSRAEKHAVKLDEVEVQLERIRVRGETESFDGVDQLVVALKGFRCFQEIKRGKVQKNREGTKVQFDLDIHVQCPETARGEG